MREGWINLRGKTQYPDHISDLISARITSEGDLLWTSPYSVQLCKSRTLKRRAKLNISMGHNTADRKVEA